MDFESPKIDEPLKEKVQNESEPEERLSKEEAQDEANMMRAKLKVIPETGNVAEAEWPEKIRFKHQLEGEKPTAEQYEQAFQAIEELKKIAEENPSSLMTFSKIKDLPLKFGAAFDIALEVVGNACLGFAPGGVMFMKGPVESGQDAKAKNALEMSEVFSDAKNRLKALQSAGEYFGKRATKVEKEKK